MSIETLWRLSRQWYDGRLHRAYRPRPTVESQRILADAGLVGDFWQLPG